MPDSPFSSQVALVTASTSGIGSSIAMHLARAGVRGVVVNGRRPEAGQALVAALKREAPQTEVLFVAADLTDAARVDHMFREVERSFGRLDIFTHCGGAQVAPALFVDQDPATFNAQIDGHFTSLMLCCHHAVRMMMAQKSGAIIAVASDAGKVATPAESVIGATKAAAIMFIRTLALELARHGIRANTITPSIVRDTKSHARLMAGEIGRKVFEKAESRARLGVPVPDDIAPLAVFLASPQASRITGQTVSVNGGISAA